MKFSLYLCAVSVAYMAVVAVAVPSPPAVDTPVDAAKSVAPTAAAAPAPKHANAEVVNANEPDDIKTDNDDATSDTAAEEFSTDLLSDESDDADLFDDTSEEPECDANHPNPGDVLLPIAEKIASNTGKIVVHGAEYAVQNPKDTLVDFGNNVYNAAKTAGNSFLNPKPKA